MTKYCCKKFHKDLVSKGFLSIDEFMEQMEKKKQLTIGISKGFADSHSGTSQGSTDYTLAYAL